MNAGRIVVLLLACWFLVGEVQAQEAGAFARMGFGARGVALGNAQAADLSGRASPYYNPALAPFTPAQQLRASVALMSFDREMQFLQFAAPIRPRAGIAAGVVYAGVENIDGRDESGYHTERFSTDEHVVFMAFGARFSDRVSGGAAIKFYRAALADEGVSTRGLGLDLGLTARLSERLHLALAASDLLAQYEWDTSDLYGSGGGRSVDRFPVRLRLGASYTLPGNRTQLLAEVESQLTLREQPGGERERTHRQQLRLGAAYALFGPLAIHVGIDRLERAALYRARPTAGFELDLPIGELRTRASYGFAYEADAGGTMHLLTVLLFL